MRQFVDDGELSGVTIDETYNNFDGLSRDDRLRYDTPRFGPFGLSASAASDSKFDVAGTYLGAFDDPKLAAAAAFASDGGEFIGVDDSASLLLASGFNLSAAAGWRDFDEGDRVDGQGDAGGAQARRGAKQQAVKRERNGKQGDGGHDVQAIHDRRVRPVTEAHPAADVRDREVGHGERFVRVLRVLPAKRSRSRRSRPRPSSAYRRR